jgi:hypothetical protein
MAALANDEARRRGMAEAALDRARPGAAHAIARKLLELVPT